MPLSLPVTMATLFSSVTGPLLPGDDAPRSNERSARLKPDQRLAALERIGWTAHRLDRDAPPVHGRKGVPGTEHHVRIIAIEPDLDAVTVRRPQRDAGDPVGVALEI